MLRDQLQGSKRFSLSGIEERAGMAKGRAYISMLKHAEGRQDMRRYVLESAKIQKQDEAVQTGMYAV